MKFTEIRNLLAIVAPFAAVGLVAVVTAVFWRWMLKNCATVDVDYEEGAS